MAFGPDGRAFITDAADRTVRVVGLARGNTAPITTAQPTVDTLDLTTGAVSDTFTVTDPDGDPLNYTVSGMPTASGTVTVVPSRPGTYTYTYTPNPGRA